MNLYNHTVVLLYMTSCSCVRKNACLSGIEQFIVFRCPQLISIYCGIVQYVVSDRPSIRLYSVYKNNQLRLPSLYAMIILLLFYVAHILCQLLLFSTPFFAGIFSFVFQYMTYMLLFHVILILFTLVMWCYSIILYSSQYIGWPTALHLPSRSLIFSFSMPATRPSTRIQRRAQATSQSGQSSRHRRTTTPQRQATNDGLS